MMNGNKKYLLAEDDEDIVELMMMALEESGLTAQAVVVHDGAEALDFLYRRGRFAGDDSELPSVVLLDLNMPKVSGLEVLRKIKGDKRLRHIPVVILTSSRNANDLKECYRCGANAYVVKPIDFQEFKYTIQQVGSFWASINEPPLSTAGSAAT